MKCPDPEWYTYVYDFNSDTIKKFNVFHSYNFLEGCKKVFKKYKKLDNLKELEKEIKGWAQYAFWSKCEYEVGITGFVAKNKSETKIDVYDQLLMNWDSFFKYIIEHKAYFLRREK